MHSDCPQLLVGQRQLLLTIGFHRPEYKNALTLAMYTAAADALEQADDTDDVRVVLIYGTAGCFTSGNDLKDFRQASTIHENHPVVRFMRALQHCRKPVVASVRGPAVGIGTTLLFHCDLVYAAQGAQLQLPFVNLGLCPEYAASYLLPRWLGHAKAAELLLLGEAFSAEQAAALGLINAVVSEEALDALVDNQIARLASQPPAALQRSKALLKQSQQPGIDMAMTAEFAAFAECLQSPEHNEAVTAFFEKRAPDFSRCK
ncbi:enoyl-CoA hydratase [Nitrosococcus wardiae]|uniref:Enoyl-CoA hydratase n=1 Tax=Nitrosococcus wardiae TaxID=1814290 RepID=A0A4V1AWF5_9GAMM|nr:enoyl-CoA hydratase [Nitrosococcus wardiae]